MRWFKCDLHMHTPFDSSNWIGDKIDKGNPEEAAKNFALACFQKKLDVIGITDHNFLSKDYLDHIYNAFKFIEREHGHKTIIFPGFEFTADVGKGIHVLCLFEHNTPTNDIDHILTECGVIGARINNGRFEKSKKRLPEILDIVQKNNSSGIWRGIVIVPHPKENSIFDNKKVSEWLQQEEFKK